MGNKHVGNFFLGRSVGVKSRPRNEGLHILLDLEHKLSRNDKRTAQSENFPRKWPECYFTRIVVVESYTTQRPDCSLEQKKIS